MDNSIGGVLMTPPIFNASAAQPTINIHEKMSDPKTVVQVPSFNQSTSKTRRIGLLKRSKIMI